MVLGRVTDDKISYEITIYLIFMSKSVSVLDLGEVITYQQRQILTTFEERQDIILL